MSKMRKDKSLISVSLRTEVMDSQREGLKTRITDIKKLTDFLLEECNPHYRKKVFDDLFELKKSEKQTGYLKKIFTETVEERDVLQLFKVMLEIQAVNVNSRGKEKKQKSVQEIEDCLGRSLLNDSSWEKLGNIGRLIQEIEASSGQEIQPQPDADSDVIMTSDEGMSVEVLQSEESSNTEMPSNMDLEDAVCVAKSGSDADSIETEPAPVKKPENCMFFQAERSPKRSRAPEPENTQDSMQRAQKEIQVKAAMPAPEEVRYAKRQRTESLNIRLFPRPPVNAKEANNDFLHDVGCESFFNQCVKDLVNGEDNMPNPHLSSDFIF